MYYLNFFFKKKNLNTKNKLKSGAALILGSIFQSSYCAMGFGHVTNFIAEIDSGQINRPIQSRAFHLFHTLHC